MKKKLLIVTGIVGIVAAITALIVRKIRRCV